MKNILYLILILISVSAAQQAGKVYVLSEGGFSAGSSKLSMLDNYTGTFTQNIFSPGNIGLYPDGLIYYEGYLYMLEQGSFGGSGKIYKLDTNGTVINSKVTGVNPYSLAISNNKVFITNGPAGNVTVLNASDFADVATIPVGVYPQEILAAGGRVYVANTSLFGGTEDRTVSVIDPVSNTELRKITVRKDPSSLAVSADGNLLVACPGDGAAGIIYKISTATYAVTDSFFSQADGVGKDIVVDRNSNKIYFLGNSGNIVEMDLNTRQTGAVISQPSGTSYFYGYNYDYLAKKHYVLDAKTFTVSGVMNVYDSNGALLNSYGTGAAPRRVVLKYDSGLTSAEKNIQKNKINLVNFPNPVKTNSRIRYTVEGGLPAGHGSVSVALRLYNLLGEKVATLLETDCAPGEYEAEFNTSALPAGVYYYSLSVNGKIFNSKMSVIK